jgi:4-amino-4-deoxy-L-arabinose transferase-like glycosyltransferase
LLAALLLYFALAAGTVRGVGLVGEVAIGWALPDPPRVLLELDPPVGAATEVGALQAARTRPIERVVVGPLSLPLAVNTYTGGLSDWPARLARAVTGSVAAGVAMHVALGALLLVLAHRFLVFHASRIAAGVAATVLASDWCFVFYRKVLGGTEILLQAAALLVIWALWSRRWRGGVHGTVAIAVGVGLGLHAKATFVATLAALAAAVLLTRWDHPALKPPRRAHPGVLLGIPLLCVAPLLLANVHQAHVDLPPLLSHDMLGLQVQRLAAGWTQRAPAREGLQNLLYFFGDPRAFFGPAYGADPVPPLSLLRGIGFGVVVLGALLEWRDRAASGGGALLRFLSIAVPLQIAALWAANRDLHHLAQASVPLALLAGLSVERVAATLGPPRSFTRGLAAVLLAAPLVMAGVLHLARTDATLATVQSPSFTESGQAELVAMLRAQRVDRLVASDYELYGMLEARAPEIAVTHVWGAVARGAKGPDVLRFARDGWYLAVRASNPMIYNWSPKEAQVLRSAVEAGVRVTPVARLGAPDAPWATLWRVEAEL